MKNFATYAIISFIGYSGNFLNAQESSSISLGSDEHILSYLKEYNVPAVGIGIIEDGELKSVKVFGEIRKGEPAPPNTIFNIASQTKPVIAMLTLKLVESGQWDLDEPLCNNWIDPDVVNDPMHKKLTTRHVLSHQSGFKNWRINHPTGKLTFDFEPGTQFQYSGEGFEYLKQTLENKFEKPIDFLLDSILLKPLGMHNTGYWSEGIDTSRFAYWHSADGERYSIPIRTSISAADDLLTTIDDYCQLGLCIINKKGLSELLLNEMTTPHVNVKRNNYYGLGWGVVTELPDNECAIHHGGSDMGVRTQAVFFTKSKRGIVIMTNGDMGNFIIEKIIKESIDIGEDFLDNFYRKNIPEIISVPEEIIEYYAGTYIQPNGSILRVEENGNCIKVSGEGYPTYMFYPESNDKFFMKEYDVDLVFKKYEASSKITMTIFEEGNMMMEVEKTVQ